MASKLGKFYGIGVGVGDPENITVKAAKRLHEVDVIVLPEAKSGEGSTAFNIVKEYVKPEVEQLFLEFPMIRDVEARKVFRKNNADVISAELEKGKNVAFLTIGDPMTYSTYTYVLEHISDDVEVETIAGITSFNSIAARLNIPLMIGDEDLIIIPGSKNTIDDLKWLKESGIAEEIIRRARTETIIFGICGGFQILGNKVKDPYHIEGDIEELNALGLLDLETIMENEKTLVQYNGKLAIDNGILKTLNNFEIKGYEIHQGITRGNEKNLTTDDRTIFVNRDNIIATYLHGIFDNKDFTDLLLNEIRKRKGLEEVNNNISYEEYKLKEFDKLEKLVRENVDIDEIYKIIGLK